MVETPVAVEPAQTPCERAEERWRAAFRWRTAFTALIFILAVVLTVMLCLAIAFAYDKKWVEAVVTGTGTVVGGSGMKWVLARWRETKRDEEAAYKEAQDRCPARVNELQSARSGVKLFGLL